MRGRMVDVVGLAEFDNVAEVHDGDPVADVLDHRKIVGDKEVCQAEFLLQILQQVDDLALDGDVEG